MTSENVVDAFPHIRVIATGASDNNVRVWNEDTGINDNS
jgi:WD40 repeat protein